MNTIINFVGDDLPVRVVLEFQPHQPEEEVDGIKSPEIEPDVDIKSISSFGYDIDNILTKQAVEALRARCVSHMLKLSETESE